MSEDINGESIPSRWLTTAGVTYTINDEDQVVSVDRREGGRRIRQLLTLISQLIYLLLNKAGGELQVLPVH